MRNFSFILCTVAAVIATPATAASFSGPRAEARVGWDRTTLDLSYQDAEDSLSGSGHKSGYDVGAEVGYDYQSASGFVAGAYAGVDYASTKKCSAVFGDDRGCLKLGRNFTVGARVGAKVSPLIMLYAKGGYSNGQIKATYHNSDDPTLDFGDHANRGGYHVGAGAEFALGQQGYIRAEYVRTNYSDYDYSDPDFKVSVDGHRDQALLGFGLRF